MPRAHCEVIILMQALCCEYLWCIIMVICSPTIVPLFPMKGMTTKPVNSLYLPLYYCHVLSAYQEVSSGDGPPTRQWVLTDVADNRQLGTPQRVAEKTALAPLLSLTGKPWFGGGVSQQLQVHVLILSCCR